jgi:FAD/FMN-containing dehydrogenase
MTIPAELLTRKAPATWINHHQTVRVSVAAVLTLRNAGSANTMANMRQTAGHVQTIIRDAVTQGVRLRTVGSRWSFSDIGGVRGGWVLETDNLQMRFVLKAQNLDPAYRGTAEELMLFQCGASIHSVNEEVEAKRFSRALRTSGASNGQTIAGAMSTGTHGSAIDVGAIETQVAGFQLLTASSNLWLERPSDPVLGEAAAGQLGATLVRDEMLFRAALVSLGTCGVVHSVLVRTTGRYRLRSHLRWMTFAQVERAMNTLDFSGLALPQPESRPYFFQVVTDPADPHTAFVTTRYKEPCPPGHVPKYDLTTGYEPGNDLPALVGRVLNVAGGLRPLVASLLIRQEMKEFDRDPLTPGETYDFTSPRSGVAGAGIAVPMAYTSRALARVREAFAKNPSAPIIAACRYVQKSPALLAFTRFDPTCVIDIDGVNSAPTLKVMEETRRLLDRDGIPYAEHWGKMHDLTAQRLRRNYGSDLDRWTEARHRLLPDAAERTTFSTPVFDAVGLNA